MSRSARRGHVRDAVVNSAIIHSGFDDATGDAQVRLKLLADQGRPTIPDRGHEYQGGPSLVEHHDAGGLRAEYGGCGLSDGLEDVTQVQRGIDRRGGLHQRGQGPERQRLDR